MATTLYLIRHGATAANLERPNRLQGQRIDPPLAPIGIRQAELTRDLLAIRPIDYVYASPLRRAMQTGAIIAAPRQKTVVPVAELTEADVGDWEGLSWEQIRTTYPAAYERFHADPAAHGYPGGESFADVAQRVVQVFERLLAQHEGKTLLVVGHHIVNRVYLASLLGLPPGLARRVKLENCSLSVVVREEGETQLATLNAAFHLHGVSAAA